MNDRILLLSVAGEPAYGAERVLASLIGHLPDEFADRCLLARPARSALAGWAAGSRSVHYDWPAARDAFVPNLRAGAASARHLRAQRIGIVHAWGARAFEPALILGRLLGARVSATLHDHPHAAIHGSARQRLIRLTAPRMRPLVCVSDALGDACRAAGLCAACPVIRNGAPSGPPRVEPGPGTVVRVGFFGLYARWKGFDLVRDWIEASGPEIEWHLCGVPDPELRAACDALQAARRPNVIFRGWVDGPTVVAEMDVLVHASTAFEPFGMVLVDSARAGIPAVASDLGGPPEIVDHGVTGFLFSPSDPSAGLAYLRRLAADPDLRARLGAAARRRFESHFTIEQMVERYAALWCGSTPETPFSAET